MIKSFFIFAILVITAMVVYFSINPSYEKSLEAKYYYETSDYKIAYKLSKEAFKIDPYNKMASTIMTQSQLALKYVRYIEDAKNYIKEIENLTNDGYLDDADRAKIRTISKIMIDSYKKLTPSVVIEENLKKEAKAYYEKFNNLLQKAS
jgi:tRNA U34 5-carboxymethylaminomethyl modifying enzyme MnmG/GidA